jgi:hypothetical protein
VRTSAARVTSVVYEALEAATDVNLKFVSQTRIDEVGSGEAFGAGIVDGGDRVATVLLTLVGYDHDWTQNKRDLPDWQEAHRRLVQEGSFRKSIIRRRLTLLKTSQSRNQVVPNARSSLLKVRHWSLAENATITRFSSISVVIPSACLTRAGQQFSPSPEASTRLSMTP